MTRPSVRVSVFRLLSAGVVLTLCMNWVGHKIRQSMDDQSVRIVEDWPTTMPDESRRVHSLDGLSIIAPRGWHASISENSIQLEAPAVPPGYLEPSMILVNKVYDRYRHPQPLPDTIRFKDGYACLKILHVRSTPYEPEWHEAHVVLEQNDEMYEILFRSHKRFSKHVPERIWDYLESFEKFQDEASLTASIE